MAYASNLQYRGQIAPIRPLGRDEEALLVVRGDGFRYNPVGIGRYSAFLLFRDGSPVDMILDHDGSARTQQETANDEFAMHSLQHPIVIISARSGLVVTGCCAVRQPARAPRHPGWSPPLVAPRVLRTAWVNLVPGSVLWAASAKETLGARSFPSLAVIEQAETAKPGRL